MATIVDTRRGTIVDIPSAAAPEVALAKTVHRYKPSRDDRDFLKKFNGIKVPKSLFHKAMKCLLELGPDGHVLEYRVMALSQLLDGEGYTGRERMDLMGAIEFRFVAFAELQQESGVVVWNRADAEDGENPNFAAAAEEPLIFAGSDNMVFDRQSFEARVLGSARVRDKTPT